ncbi:MAG: CotH kinase family protein, partial [Saprospiraceae bacterium]
MKKLLFTLIIILPNLIFAQAGKTVRPMFDKKTIGEVHITFANKNWVDALDSMRVYGMGLMNASVTIDGKKYDGVGVRFRGDKSYQTGLKRNPFTIKLNSTNPEQNHQGYTALKISSALRDPSLVREVLYQEISGKYMPTPLATYTKLYVNDEYIGIFVNVESIDKQFVSSHFGSSGNAFFKAGVDYKPEIPTTCKQNIFGSLEYEDNLECYKGNFEMTSGEGWGELQELTKALNSDPAKIDKILDVDNALWMLALNNVMVNLSSYSGAHSVNYYLYKDGNGRFQPVPWDLNLAFGSYKNTGSGSDLELKDLQTLDPLLHADNPLKPLISQLLKDPLNRKIYLAHIRQILEEN